MIIILLIKIILHEILYIPLYNYNILQQYLLQRKIKFNEYKNQVKKLEKLLKINVDR